MSILEYTGVAIASSTKPLYRYHEEAPKNITVPVDALLSKLPPSCRIRENPFSGGGKIDLPCDQLFQGNTPRLKLGLLHDLLPDDVRIPDGEDRDQLIALPPGWLSLYYELEIRRVELPHPKSPVMEKASTSSAKDAGNTDPDAEKAEKVGKVDLPAVICSPKQIVESPKTPEPVMDVEVDVPLEQASAKALPPANGIFTSEKKRGFFASLPIFQKHEPAAFIAHAHVRKSPVLTRALEPVPPVYEPRKRSEPSIEEITPPPEKTMEDDPKEESLSLERLWRLDPQDQFAEPSTLQALFMTEEKLTLEGVMALSGQLPGLKACVLAHGDQVVCSSSVPAGVDLKSLSTQATTMLAQIRESSSKMGLGAVPAITLHAEQGVLSFLYHGELCLLVLHADRGFVPGVRERLQEMLGYLSNAKALPSGASAQPSLPI